MAGIVWTAPRNPAIEPRLYDVRRNWNVLHLDALSIDIKVHRLLGEADCDRIANSNGTSAALENRDRLAADIRVEQGVIAGIVGLRDGAQVA